MAKPNEEIETVIFQALSHPMRRTVIQLLEGNTKGVLYTEIITEIALPTGKLNYHLEQLEGLIEKNPEHRYVLTPLGRKALSQLKQLKYEVTEEDEKYLSIAKKSQRSSLEPTIRSFIIIGIIASLTIVMISSVVGYVIITEGGAPLPVLVILPLAIAFEVGLAVTLFRALRNVPAWVRKLERRFL